MPLRTRFDPQPKGVRLFSDTEREEAYLHARPFFLDQMTILLEDGWKRNDDNSEEVLFDISKPRANKGRSRGNLILPKTFSSFLDASKADTWRAIFENTAIFQAKTKGKNCNHDLSIGPSPPLSNIFYLLQVLAPGMLVIYHEYRFKDTDVRVSMMLPQPSWIENNIEVMSKMDALLAAAKDRKIAFHEERTPRPQNNSSLPGTDALPEAAKDQKAASSHKEGTARPQNNSNFSSLPGTDALPAAANDQKAASHKGKGRPQNTSSLPGMNALPAAAKDQKAASHKGKGPPQNDLYSTFVPASGTDALPAAAKDQKKTSRKARKGQSRNDSPKYPGYLSMSVDDPWSAGDDMDYTACDKDCGWCGRCPY